MSLFLHSNYRDFLNDHIANLPKKGHGQISKIAKAINVHQSLVSLILAGERDLTLEQGYDLAEYLGLTEFESDYFSLLIQHARAGNIRYKKSIEKKLEKIKTEATQISKRVSHEKVLTDQQRAINYSSWIYSAVRMYTSVEEKGVTVEQVQNRFRLPRPTTIDILNFLEQTGLVDKVNDLYQVGSQRTFLEHGSPHLLKHHANWRIKALQQSSLITEKELMFTSPMAISRKDFAVLRERTAEFIKEFLKTVADSPSEELACLNIDFFWVD